MDVTNVKFKREELDEFDTMHKCLLHTDCIRVLQHYLKKKKEYSLLRLVKLWLEVPTMPEEELLEALERVDGFNMAPLYSLSEPQHKHSYVKTECCRILDNILPDFVHYLRTHHAR